MSTAGLLVSLKMGPSWAVVIFRSDFEFKTMFGFLNLNYMGQSTFFNLKTGSLTSFRVFLLAFLIYHHFFELNINVLVS